MTPFCEIKYKRARDLTDRDVVRIRRPGQGSPIWREVLQVYRNQEELDAEMDLSQSYQAELAKQADHAFNRVTDAYVIIRVWLHEESPVQMEDAFVTLYRNDLVEVQSLPAWEPAARPGEPKQD